MKILITGVGGLVMSRVAENLIRNYDLCDLYGIDDFSFGCIENVPEQLSFDQVDFDRFGEKFLNQYDILIHGAVSNLIYSQTQPEQTFKNNALKTLNLFSKFHGKIIFTSTASVYNNASVIPTDEDAPVHCVNSYDSSKRIAELYLQARGNYTTLRLSNVYGINQRSDNPYCGAVGRMIGQALKGEPITINGDGTDTRDYSFSEDVAEAIFKAADRSALNTEVNISSMTETNALDLSKLICKELNVVHKIERIPKRSIDSISRRCLNNNKAFHLLGWSPTISLEEGVKRTIQWQKSLS